MIEELWRRPIVARVLHWWTGKADKTEEAVGLGRYFLVHPAVARHSKFRTRVPPERILIETDFRYADPPAALPCRIEWVEHLVGQQHKLCVGDVRLLSWHNLARTVRGTDTARLFPEMFQRAFAGVDAGSG